MEVLTYTTAGTLIVAALIALVYYFRVVARGHHAFLHVILALLYIVGAEALLIHLTGESASVHVAVAAVNLLGIGAMVSLVNRFHPPRERRSAIRVSGLNMPSNATLGYLMLLAFVVIGFALTGRNIDHIQELREQRIADQAAIDHTVCDRQNKSFENIRNLNLILSNLILAVTEPTGDDRETGDDDSEALMDAVRLLRRERRGLRHVDCEGLRSQRPFTD